MRLPNFALPLPTLFRRNLALGSLPTRPSNLRERWTSTPSNSCSSAASTTRSASSTRPSRCSARSSSKNDRLADVHDMLGVICHSRGNFAQAEHHFERALAINPSYTEAALNLAVTYNDRGKYEAAREVYARIRGHARRQPAGPRSVRARQDRQHARRGRPGLRRRGARRARPSSSTRRPSRSARSSPTCGRSSARCCARSTTCRARASSTRPPSRRGPTYVPARIQLGVTLLSLGESDAAPSSGARCSRSSPTTSARRCTCA